MVGTGRAATPEEAPTVFYVDNHGWHSGIIVPRAAIPSGAWPPGVVEGDFAGCAYLELGWGDRKFYPAKKPTAGMAVVAALVPGPSVLHVAGFAPPLSAAHAWSSLVAVPCTPAELAGLCRELGRSFETDAQGNVARMGAGLYGRRSGFYPARGQYWIGNTCNTWTAREMRAGGLAAHTNIFEALTSGEVIGQARRLVSRGKSKIQGRPKVQEPRFKEDSRFKNQDLNGKGQIAVRR